jgi:hypothetical protein
MATLRHRSIIIIDDEDIVAVDDDLIILDHGTIHLPSSLYSPLPSESFVSHLSS